jgi:hypothetical protein
LADIGSGITVDDYGQAFVVGATGSSESSFPVKVGPHMVHKGHHDCFIAKINREGSDLVYCGYIGGINYDHGLGIAIDAYGNAYVAGETLSDENSFPTINGPDLTHNSPTDSSDAFIAKIVSSGRAISYCGYIGGAEHDSANEIAVDEYGCAYVAGTTSSDENSFPVTWGPDLSHNDTGLGGTDAFVTKIAISLYADSYCIPEQTGKTINFKLNSGAINSSRTFLLLGSVSGTTPGYPLPGGHAVLPLNWDPFTYAVLLHLNSSVFVNFLDTLDANGQATAQLNSGPLRPGFVGTIIYFAYCLNDPFDFASDPVEIEIVP